MLKAISATSQLVVPYIDPAQPLVKTYVFARLALVVDRPTPRVVTASAHLFTGRLATARLRPKSFIRPVESIYCLTKSLLLSSLNPPPLPDLRPAHP